MIRLTRPTGRAAVLLALPLLVAAAATGEEKRDDDRDKPLPTLAVKTAGMSRHDGFLPFWTDERRGTVWLELTPPGEGHVVAEAIYVEGLRRGLGSNPVGLDRGQLGDAKLLRIRRLGPKVLFEQPNLRYRALAAGDDERRATAESFASSVIWGAEIGALDPDGRALVDLGSFLVRDAHGVAATLKRTEQGPYELDVSRSAVDLDQCLAFPDNLELEAVLTYALKEGEPGGHVASTAPTAEAVTLIQHHSLVRLPDDGYRPRRLDPRIGMNGIAFHDYAAGLAEPIHRRWITRHRLRKVDPTAPRSPAVEPLIYYVDRGAPEPVRSALIEGASWWAAAFEAAGFEDAFRVELLPPDAHPLDVRYNVIQWVHRSTRGWSYGGGVIDPRTGEILKGHVTLGSLRVRQDRLLFEGLAGTAKTGSGDADDPIELALARIRQLAAHEVGHTLGITHNFAASTYDDRASVMDYPAPLIGIGDGGELDFSRAYGVGVGSWDVHTVRYGYSEFPPGADEEAELEAIVRQGLERGLLFLADRDARPLHASEPRANLWDNGADPVAGLEHALAVRALALGRFGAANVLPGTPLAELEEVLAPLYFHHRYQLDAAVKVIGGMEYAYAVRGDGQVPTTLVDGGRQRRALEVVLSVLEPAVLDLPEEVLELLAPRPFAWSESREQLANGSWPAFDALGAAATAADQVLALLLAPERLARLVDFHRRQPSLPGLEEVLAALLDHAFPPAGAAAETPRRDALRRVVQRAVVDRLILHADAEHRPAVRAHLEAALATLRQRLQTLLDDGRIEAVHGRALLADVGRFLDRTTAGGTEAAAPPPPPPGSPIGAPPLGACGQSPPWLRP
ncbi:MAG: DUF5117 domain-containing protein [Acidobacteria bacterium]|nr:MAG: DUF5117 domain-containing protein [Acidobacteriota bacterium]